VAWGFRNPFGLAFSPGGQLYVTDNGYDDRGSRPIFGAGDLLWKVRRGAWHGWPDFSGDMPLAQNHFSVPGKPRPRVLFKDLPNQPPRPAAILGVHSSTNGFDFSHQAEFGHRGEAFVALFGDQAPDTGKVVNVVGAKVVRVNVTNGVIEDFAINKGHINAPASAQRGGGLERPIAARFDPSGRALYVVDFGVLLMDSKGAHPKTGTGVLWRIMRDGR
jgi:glucose/arabinose dehydrogenase